jgi:hypothetical protein
MKRVGTISSAAGLIYLGVWMILRKTNPNLAVEVFKWWPAIIVLIGVEVLVYFNMKKEEERVGFNGLIIPVVLVLLFINIFQGIYNGVRKNINLDLGNGMSINKMIDEFKGVDLDRYRKIETSKTITPAGKAFTFSADNADLSFKKSPDGNIRIDAQVYVDRLSSAQKYEILEQKSSDGIVVNIKNPDIKRVTADIYVPDGLDIRIDTDNLRVKNQDGIPETSFDVKADNGSATFNGIKSVSAQCDNTSVEIKDVQTVKISGDSGVARLNGKVENIDIKLDNGTVDADNELSDNVNININNGKVTLKNKTGKNVNIKLNDGMATYKTEDKNVNVAMELNSGVCNLNGERRVNTGITRIFGTGEGKVKIDVDNGSASFSSQE